MTALRRRGSRHCRAPPTAAGGFSPVVQQRAHVVLGGRATPRAVPGRAPDTRRWPWRSAQPRAAQRRPTDASALTGAARPAGRSAAGRRSRGRVRARPSEHRARTARAAAARACSSSPGLIVRWRAPEQRRRLRDVRRQQRRAAAAWPAARVRRRVEQHAPGGGAQHRIQHHGTLAVRRECLGTPRAPCRARQHPDLDRRPGRVAKAASIWARSTGAGTVMRGEHRADRSARSPR